MSLSSTNSYVPAVHMFSPSIYYPEILIFANWNTCYGPLRWFELENVNCMKKPHGCQLKITLDFQITHHGLETHTEKTSLIKSSLKNGQNYWKNTFKGWRWYYFVKVADWRSANLLKINPRKGILKNFRSSCSQVFCELGAIKKFAKLT